MNRTTDTQYADLLARLHAIPAITQPKREQARQQALEHLVEDLIEANGEAPW